MYVAPAALKLVLCTGSDQRNVSEKIWRCHSVIVILLYVSSIVDNETRLILVTFVVGIFQLQPLKCI